MTTLTRELGFRLAYGLLGFALSAAWNYASYGPMIEYASAYVVVRSRQRLCFESWLWVAAWPNAAAPQHSVYCTTATESAARAWQDLALVFSGFSHEFPLAGSSWVLVLVQLCPTTAYAVAAALATVRPGLHDRERSNVTNFTVVVSVVLLSLVPWLFALVVGFDSLTREGLDSELKASHRL